MNIFDIAVAKTYTSKSLKGAGSVQGKPGKDGNGIVSITKESSTGKVDTYKILFTDNTSTTFTVTNATTVTDLSQLNNDTEFITNTVNNLVNYYTKANIYSKDEIGNLLQNIGAGLSVMVVPVLPTENISATTIYLVNEGTDNNSYEQWMYIAGQWASLGSTTIDLSAYYTKNDIDNLLLGYITTSSLTTILADYVKKTELASVATSGSYNDLKDLPTIPTTEGLATEKYVNDAINNISSSDEGRVDLSDYYKKSETYNKNEVNSLIPSITVDSTISDTSKNPVQNKVIKKYVDEKSVDVSTENGNAIQEKTDGLYVNDLTADFDKFNIAQKTVNEVGSVSLLKNPVSFNIESATNYATAKWCNVSKDIILTGNITNYDSIEFLFRPNYSGKIRPAQPARFRVKNIGFNNSNTQNENNNSVIPFLYSNATNATDAHGLTPTSVIGWFKNATTFRVSHIQNTIVSGDTQTWEITDIIGIKDRSVTIDPVEYVDTESGIEDTPVGHIISHMGNEAPKHYLICDGTEYNIADYPLLAQHFKDEFGSYNYFGGNGTTTFAVPDLRGEFLRGTGSNSRDGQGDGAEVGVHQDATAHMFLGVNTSAKSLWTDTSSPIGNSGQVNGNGKSNINADSSLKLTTNANTTGLNFNSSNNWSPATNTSHYTSRPTNTSVLYCIKYETTYFMKIEGKDVYSTKERMIGYWIDSKPLYKKTIPMEITNVNGIAISKDITSLAINDLISITGSTKSTENITVIIPHVNPVSGAKFIAYLNGAYLKVEAALGSAYLGSTAYITIEYTKTTD